MAFVPGVLFVADHGRWSNPQQLIVGKVTIQVDTIIGSFRREYEITAGDVFEWANQIATLLINLSAAHGVPIKQNVPGSFDRLTATRANWPDPA